MILKMKKRKNLMKISHFSQLIHISHLVIQILMATLKSITNNTTFVNNTTCKNLFNKDKRNLIQQQYQQQQQNKPQHQHQQQHPPLTAERKDTLRRLFFVAVESGDRNAVLEMFLKARKIYPTFDLVNSPNNNGICPIINCSKFRFVIKLYYF
eukprot:UN05861